MTTHKDTKQKSSTSRGTQKSTSSPKDSLKKRSTFLESLLLLPGIHFLYRHKNFCFLFLAFLSVLAITHVKYVGVTLDYFVFATFFGYFRYVFYALVFLTLFVFVFNIQQRSFFRYSIYFLVFTIFLGSSWSFVIASDQHHVINQIRSFRDCWSVFKNSYNVAWQNTNHTFQHYDLMPGGVFGVFLYSCFYVFQNSNAAQVIFWIVTILVFLLSVGYFVFRDFFFIIRCAEALKLLFIEFANLFQVKILRKSRIVVAKQLLKGKSTPQSLGTPSQKSSENFFYHLKQERYPSTYSEKKRLIPRSQNTAYDPDDRIENTFADRTREIIRSTILKKYTAFKSRDEFAEYQDNKVNVSLLKNHMQTFFELADENKKRNFFQKKKESNKKQYQSRAKLNPDDKKMLLTLRKNLFFFKYNERRYRPDWPLFDFSKLKFEVQQQNRLEIRNYARKKEDKLLSIFLENKIPAKIVKINVSNKFIQYEMTIPNNVMVNRIRALSDNIKLGLAEPKVFFEIPLKNRNTFGIEIANPFSTIITFKEIFQKMIRSGVINNLCHKLFIGQTSSGKNVIEKFSEMPHLLIAGATGSGKSVELRNIILSLTLTNPPHKLNLILIDPKKVEFCTFYDLPHLLTPVIYTYEKIIIVLDKLIAEMENRYKILQQSKCVNIDEYNKEQKNERLQLPKIILIFDEFADFILQGGRQLEMKIVRISQLSRAAGIHLILATQRPSSKVITGLIKINFPCRIAFACSSGIDSRIVIDKSGAEELLGNGDMLYTSSQNYRPQRLQAPFIDQRNAEIICNFLRKAAPAVYVKELNIDYETTAENC